MVLDEGIWLLQWLIVLASLLFGNAQESCLGFSSSFGNCYDCVFTHYRSPNMTSDRLVYPSDCIARKNESIKMSIFISSKKCLNQTACNGSALYPYDEINKGLWEAHKKANEYMASSVNIYLLNGPHYILRKNLPQVSFGYFRRTNASVAIQPCYCTFMNVPGCLKDFEQVEILMKTDNFVLFVSNSLRMTNIFINGSDMHLITRSDYNQMTNCYNLEKVCCNQSEINATYSTTKPCSLVQKDIYVTPLEQWYNKTGFINVEPILDDPLRIPPRLDMQNITFVDLYSGKSIYGWVSIVLLGGNIRNSVEMRNIVFNNMKLIRALLYTDNHENINTNAAFLKGTWAIRPGEENTITLRNCFVTKYNYYDISIGGSLAQPDLGLFSMQEFRGSVILSNVTFYRIITTQSQLSLFTLKRCYSVRFEQMSAESIENVLIGYGFESNVSIVNSICKNIKQLDIFIIEGGCNFKVESFYFLAFTGKPAKFSRFLGSTDSLVLLRDMMIDRADYFAIELYSSNVIVFNVTFSNSILIRSFIKLINSDIYMNTLDIINIRLTFSDLFFYRGVSQNSFVISNFYLERIIAEVDVAVFRWISGIYLSLFQATYIDIYDSSLPVVFSIDQIGKIYLADMKVEECLALDSNSFGCSLIFAISVDLVVLTNIHLKKLFTDGLIRVAFCFRTTDCFLFVRNISIFDSERSQEDWVSITLSNAELQDIFIENLMNRFLDESPKRLFSFSNMKKVNITSFGFIIYDSNFQVRGILETLNTANVRITNVLVEKKNSFAPSEILLPWFCTVISNYRGVSIFITEVYLKNLEGSEIESSLAYKNGFLSFYGFDSETFLWENEVSVVLKGILVENCRGWPNGIIGLVNINSILLEALTIINCSALKGGGVHINWASQAFLFNVSFLDTSAFYGGSIFASNVKFFNGKSLFGNRTSAEEGGLLHLSAILSAIIEDLETVYSNAFQGGVLYVVEVVLKISDFKAISSESKNEGGIFYMDSGNLQVERGLFGSPRAKSGGAFFILLAKEIKLYNISIFDALVSNKGVSIFFDEVPESTIENLLMTGNFGREARGNIIILSQTRNNYLFKNFFCYQNQILFGSCLFYNSNINLTIINFTAFENSGSLLQFSSHSRSFISISCLNILANNKIDSSIVRTINTVMFQDCFVNISGISRLEANAAEEALFFFERCELQIANVTFFENKVIHLIDHYAILVLLNSLANLKRVRYEGGNKLASFISAKESEVVMMKSEVEGCQSSELSCASFESLEKVYMEDCVFKNNKANRVGAISLKNTQAIFNNCYFCNNTYTQPLSLKLIDSSYPTSKLRAADIGSEGKGVKGLTMFKCNFTFHEDSLSVSAYLCENINVIDCFFQSTVGKGAGLLIFSTRAFISNCVFRELAADEGAAIKIFSFDPTTALVALIESSEFSFNKANVGGSILLQGRIKASISKSKFYYNVAVGEFAIGGAIYFTCLGCSSIEIELVDNFFEGNYAFGFAPTIFSQAKISSASTGNRFKNNSDLIGFTEEFSCFPVTIFISKISYSDKIHNQTAFNSTIISGQDFDFGLYLYDSLGNRLIFDNSSISTIRRAADDINYFQILRGFSKSESGMHSFKGVRIYKKPNSLFSVEVSVEIDETRFLPRALERHSLSNTSFTWKLFSRPCYVGEILNAGDSSCFLCPEGQFSIVDPMFNERMHSCLSCPRNALCRGGFDLSPLPGFWRAGKNGTKIVECLSHSFCLGGLGESLSEDERASGRCLIHHSGNLCYTCDPGYARSSARGQCEVCASNTKMNVKLALALVFVVFYIILQIKLTFSGRGTNAIGIMMKQLLTHYQIIHMISILDLGWTSEIVEFFRFQEYLSFMSEDLISLDCIYSEVNNEMLVLRVIASNLIPVVLNVIMIAMTCGMILYRRIKRRETTLSQVFNLFRLSNVIIIYIFFPEILRKTFSLVSCIVIDQNGSMVLTMSPGLKCWDARHYEIILRIALPGILIWGIFIPLLALYLLLKNKKAIRQYIAHLSAESSPKHKNPLDSFIRQPEEVRILNFSQFKIPSRSTSSVSSDIGVKKLSFARKGGEPQSAFEESPTSNVKGLTRKVKFSFKVQESRVDEEFFGTPQAESFNKAHGTAVALKFIYRGYKGQYLYWELIIFLRKFCLIVISSVTGLFPNNVKATILLVLLSFFLFLQMRFQPFELQHLNKIELLSLLVTFVTANIGILLYSEDLQIVNTVFVLILLIMNLSFVLFWIFIFFAEARRIYLQRRQRLKQAVK